MKSIIGAGVSSLISSYPIHLLSQASEVHDLSRSKIETIRQNAKWLAINYDWYHPQVATRHTLQEVETWFEDAGLKIEYRCADFYGITLRGRNV